MVTGLKRIEFEVYKRREDLSSFEEVEVYSSLFVDCYSELISSGIFVCFDCEVKMILLRFINCTSLKHSSCFYIKSIQALLKQICCYLSQSYEYESQSYLNTFHAGFLDMKGETQSESHLND